MEIIIDTYNQHTHFLYLKNTYYLQTIIGIAKTIHKLTIKR